MDYQLVIVKGRSASKAIPLADGVTTVGRQDSCQLRIKSAQVSRRHCELFEKKGMLLVKDLGSANGTWVNGKKVEGQRVLEPGDELLIGAVALRVVKVATPAPAARAPGSKPGDTAIVAAMGGATGSGTAAAAPAEAADEFDIEFDDEALATDVPNPVIPTPPTPSGAPSQPAAKSHDTHEPSTGDEAIADFLLGIKLEDEE